MSMAYGNEDCRLALERLNDLDDEIISSGELRTRLASLRRPSGRAQT
jgi:hypothetical protein